MARDVTDLLSVEIKSALTGHKRLHSVMSLDVNETDPAAEAVKTMRIERKAIGHKSGVSDYEVELGVKRLVPEEVDWYELKRTRALVTIYYEERAGNLAAERFVLEDVRITEISATGDAEGTADLTIKGIPLDHRKEG